MKTSNKQVKRFRRKARIRAKISGTATRPRMNVYRSLRGMYVQLIDDENGKTMLSVNSKKDVVSGDAGERKGRIAQAYNLGKALAEKAKEKNITKIIFDRSGYKYHGRVKAVSDGARDCGLDF